MDPEAPLPPMSVSALIAWLSLCMLAAAWGQSIDEHWRGPWLNVGTFGLVAAVAFGSIEKAQIARTKWLRQQSERKIFEGRLERLNEQNVTIESINNAIRQLARHAGSELNRYPLEVMPAGENGEAFEFGSARTIIGLLRKISSSAVSFEYEQAFPERIVLLTFHVGKRLPLCFVVDVMQTQKSTCGFISSGAVMAVGVPAEHGPKPELVESIQNV